MLAVLERKGVRLVKCFGAHVAIELYVFCLRLCLDYLALIVLLALNIFNN